MFVISSPLVVFPFVFFFVFLFLVFTDSDGGHDVGITSHHNCNDDRLFDVELCGGGVGSSSGNGIVSNPVSAACRNDAPIAVVIDRNEPQQQRRRQQLARRLYRWFFGVERPRNRGALGSRSYAGHHVGPPPFGQQQFPSRVPTATALQRHAGTSAPPNSVVHPSPIQ